MNELKENSLNQKSKSRLSLEIIQYKPAPLLPAVAMEISPTIFGWIQYSSWGEMWRMRMCLCEWLCECVGASIYVCLCLSGDVYCMPCFSVILREPLAPLTLEERLIDNAKGHFRAWSADILWPNSSLMSLNYALFSALPVFLFYICPPPLSFLTLSHHLSLSVTMSLSDVFYHSVRVWCMRTETLNWSSNRGQTPRSVPVHTTAVC